jgi:hypothetical protein
MENELVHPTPLPEAHLGLGRVHVHVHAFRRQFQEQREGRMAVVVQHVPVGLADGVGQQFIPHEAAVDEQVLGVAPRPGIGGQAGQAEQAQRAGGFIQGAGGRREVLAQHFQGAGLPVGNGKTPRYLAVVGKGEGAFRMGQGQAAQGLVAMAVFGGGSLEEFAPGRGIEEQVPGLHHGAPAQGGGLGRPQQAVQGTDPPGVGLAPGAAADRHPRHGGDAGQGLAAEAQADHPLQVPQAGDLAGGVAGQGQGQVIRADAGAVVRHPDQLDAAFLQVHPDIPGARVQAVLQQFLEGRGRPLHHLAGGNLGDEQVGKEVDGGHGRHFNGHVRMRAGRCVKTRVAHPGGMAFSQSDAWV